MKSLATLATCIVTEPQSGWQVSCFQYLEWECLKQGLLPQAVGCQYWYELEVICPVLAQVFCQCYCIQLWWDITSGQLVSVMGGVGYSSISGIQPRFWAVGHWCDRTKHMVAGGYGFLTPSAKFHAFLNLYDAPERTKKSTLAILSLCQPYSSRLWAHEEPGISSWRRNLGDTEMTGVAWFHGKSLVVGTQLDLKWVCLKQGLLPQAVGCQYWYELEDICPVFRQVFCQCYCIQLWWDITSGQLVSVMGGVGYSSISGIQPRFWAVGHWCDRTKHMVAGGYGFLTPSAKFHAFLNLYDAPERTKKSTLAILSLCQPYSSRLWAHEEPGISSWRRNLGDTEMTGVAWFHGKSLVVGTQLDQVNKTI